MTASPPSDSTPETCAASPVSVPRLRMKAWVQVDKSIPPDGGAQLSETLNMGGVYSDEPNSENRSYWKATPNLSLHAQIDNPAAFGALDGVKHVYIDITPAD
jgi:hypothetical protein